MDLEILGWLPFKKVGQEFVIPFYEPSSPKYSYYKCTVTAHEKVNLIEDGAIKCWVLNLAYNAEGSSYATMWISDKTREIIKVRQVFRTKTGLMNIYKVKIF